uniref:Uncharacterized protein n=1 Tax=Arundo donax TaxID=35708 RepID=A0A0A9B204_ARUDO
MVITTIITIITLSCMIFNHLINTFYCEAKHVKLSLHFH